MLVYCNNVRYSSGYEYGAAALGESLKMVDSKLKRIVMVTPEVTTPARELLSLHWELRDVPPISCEQKFHESVNSVTHKGEGMAEDLKRWNTACTKFNVWKMEEFHRLIFMDSDMIVTEPIDDALYEYSNASLVACPEVFPPDTFNSGFMVITPSRATYKKIMRLNKERGSLEGGDQGILAQHLCPEWYSADSDDKNCGRLPWTFNVEAQYYALYKVYRAGYGLGPMRVVHFINDGKPWKTLMFDLNRDNYQEVPSMIAALSEEGYVAPHMFWRYCFLRASGHPRPAKSIYYSDWEEVVERRGVFDRIHLPLFEEDPNNRRLPEPAAAAAALTSGRRKTQTQTQAQTQGKSKSATNKDKAKAKDGKKKSSKAKETGKSKRKNKKRKSKQ